MYLLRGNLQPHAFAEIAKSLKSEAFRRGILRRFATTSHSDPIKPISLARQPVPPLEDTLNKYLKSVRPFLSQDEYKRTESLVVDFKGGVGRTLQDFLNDRASKEENWLSEWWLNAAYLEFRKTVVAWSSPGLVFPLQSFASSADQLTYAANLVLSALQYKARIDNGEIPQEMMGTDPLDMAQYNKIFGTCRIPQAKRDRLTYEDPRNKSRHIIVAHSNHFFKLTVYYDDGSPLSVEDLYDNLLAIVETSLERGIPVGILTTDDRDAWSESYQLLMKDGKNASTLKEIEKSLFLLCLDSIPDASSEKCNAQTKAALQCVHGGGSNCNAGNRWFDKTIQFIVNRGGQVGLTYEHSPAEGQPIAVMMDFIVDHMEKKMEIVDVTTTRNYAVKNEKLPFVVTDQVKNCISAANKNLNALVNDLEMRCFTYEPYGKNLIKSLKFSPDSYVQMALQYAFYRLHKVPGAHYESAAARKFAHGRTETIRSCSTESVAFAKNMLDSSVSKYDKIKALSTAITAHKDYTVQALNGLGVDRHLLGLKLAANNLGLEQHALFSDAGYARSTHMRISTSQVASKCDGFMCYGPLVEDGYACCYNPRKNSMNFATSAMRSCSDTNLADFANSLKDSLDEMKGLFD